MSAETPTEQQQKSFLKPHLTEDKDASGDQGSWDEVGDAWARWLSQTQSPVMGFGAFREAQARISCGVHLFPGFRYLVCKRPDDIWLKSPPATLLLSSCIAIYLLLD